MIMDNWAGGLNKYVVESLARLNINILFNDV